MGNLELPFRLQHSVYRAGAQERIDAAWLALSPSVDVARWLQEHVRVPEASVYADMWRHDAKGRTLLEYLLVRRADPIIDLALARYGCSTPAIQRVFDRGGAATRLACLANPAGSMHLQQAVQVLRDGRCHLQLQAFFANTHLAGALFTNICAQARRADACRPGVRLQGSAARPREGRR